MRGQHALRFAVAVVLMVAAGSAPAQVLRVGQFNIQELSTAKLLEVDADGAGANPQVLAATAIIQEIRPDILIVNEIDHDLSTDDLALNARRFVDLYLNRGPGAIDYPNVFAAPCNTGRPSGQDLNGDGHVATAADTGQRSYGGDCFGFGNYAGQYSMAVLSRYPLEADSARSWQHFRWVDLPDNLILPDWFSDSALSVFRLSSKSHWDLPVRVGDARLHLLVSHPTPTGYDGPEDLNGRRNYDELRLWAHILDDDAVPVDDAGRRGGLPAGERFVIAGDLNADPGGDILPTGRRSIAQLLEHPRVQDSGPFLTSAGALQGRAPGPPDFVECRTAAWPGGGVRIDYLLPSRGLTPLGGGVYWPDPAVAPEGAARAALASDHRMTWLDLRLD
jgi:hypothetical protein